MNIDNYEKQIKYIVKTRKLVYKVKLQYKNQIQLDKIIINKKYKIIVK